jgi:molybdopterin-binding protein
MSQFVATIKNIDNIDSLNIVEFDFLGTTLKMMSLGLSSEIQLGKKVKLSVKPTNIIIAKNILGDISLSNNIVATIKQIENGKLLSSILLKIGDIFLESIITKDSSLRMNLQINDEVSMYIKASDLSIKEVLND